MKLGGLVVSVCHCILCTLRVLWDAEIHVDHVTGLQRLKTIESIDSLI